jgi:hypothetical protein
MPMAAASRSSARASGPLEAVSLDRPARGSYGIAREAWIKTGLETQPPLREEILDNAAAGLGRSTLKMAEAVQRAADTDRVR